MPLLTAQDLNVVAQNEITYETLDGSDTFVFSSSKSQLLLVKNATGAEINATLLGDEAPATVTCQGIGVVTVTGEPLDVVDSATSEVSLYLNVIATKLKGTVTITGGTGLEAALIQL